MAGNLLLADAIVEVWDDAAAMVVVLWKSTLCVFPTCHLALCRITGQIGANQRCPTSFAHLCALTKLLYKNKKVSYDILVLLCTATAIGYHNPTLIATIYFLVLRAKYTVGHHAWPVISRVISTFYK